MQSVYDQLLRYELKHNALPKKLSDLVPEYLREEQLIANGKELYIFDREKRSIALASKGEIDGLYKYEIPAVVLVLPDAKNTEANSYVAESARITTELDKLNTKSIQAIPESGKVITKAVTNDQEFSIDWEKTHQTIVGFGGTMGWIHPQKDDRKKVFDLLFDDLGVSFLRVRALGGEGDDELSLEPKNDNDDPQTFNWSKFPIKKTEYKQAIIIKAALAHRVKTIVPVTWSPPAWMKTIETRAGGGFFADNMTAELAELWAAYLHGMKREYNIGFKYISIQNEPDIGYYYPTCKYTFNSYAEALSAVQGRLKKEKLPTRVIGPDSCRIYNMPDYLEAMEKKGYVKGLPILTHLYDLNIDFDVVEKDAPRWQKARELARAYKRPLWLMETANYLSDGVKGGTFEEALVWAQKIHYALVDGDCEVVCYWALFFDKEGESLIYCPKSESREIKITPKYYTSKNYYRFIRLGMIRTTVKSPDSKILISAYTTKDEIPKRAIVIINTAKKTKIVRVPIADNSKWTCYTTTKTQNCKRSEISERNLELPALSVITLTNE